MIMKYQLFGYTWMSLATLLHSAKVNSLISVVSGSTITTKKD